MIIAESSKDVNPGTHISSEIFGSSLVHIPWLYNSPSKINANIMCRTVNKVKIQKFRDLFLHRNVTEKNGYISEDLN